MKEVYPERLAVAKRPAHDFATELDSAIRRKVGEFIQAALEAEVDEALQRFKYERASGVPDIAMATIPNAPSSPAPVRFHFDDRAFAALSSSPSSSLRIGGAYR